MVKCGDKGAIGRSKNEPFKVKPIRINPIDTTGAGDSFNAGFIYYFICKGRSLKESMIFANALGALSCLYIGGAEKRISEEDVLEFLKAHGV